MSNKRKLVIISVCLCMVCAVVTMIDIARNNDMTKETSIEYVNDEYDQILPHDGEVLVDSLKIREVSEAEVENNIEVTETVTSDDISVSNDKSTYFEEMRANIEVDRNNTLAMLSETIEEAAGDEEKKSATEKKLALIEYMSMEKHIESVIETKGLPECFVLISDNAVNVTVNKQDLAQNEVVKICDVVMRETEREASEIIIQSAY